MTNDGNNQDTWRVFRIMAEFVEGFESLANLGKAVTIFGSARTHPDDPFYSAAAKTAAAAQTPELVGRHRCEILGFHACPHSMPLPARVCVEFGGI